ncbi:UNVERIFIED_CONTAM: hypothetical protein FKN15_053669 [Acipenser sinensis]
METIEVKEGGSNRPKWSRQIEFTLAGIGYAVGLGNVWRFPYLCYRSGGGAFLVPYFIMLVLVGIPLLYMELTLGQYLQLGPIHAMAKVCPLLKGVGVATVAISFIMCTYYNVVITWALYYLFSSFQSPLPWQSCNNTWNVMENCTDHLSNRSAGTTTASQQFFNYRVLERTGGVGEAGTMRWELFCLLFLAWVLIYFSIFKGVKSTGKVVYFTALFPYVILLALLINNAQLPGAIEGIKFFIIPEWEKLAEVEVWVNAAAQIFNSIGIAFGSLISMSSYNTFNNNILKDTLAISITNSVTSILAGFVIFSAFGYMSYLQNVPVSSLAVDGPALVYVVYPQAFANMPVAPLWAVLFFIMLICLGLDSQFAMVEVMVTSLMDGIGSCILKYLKRKEFAVLLVCTTAFLLGIPHVMQIILVFTVLQFKPARYEGNVYPPWAQGIGWVICMASIIWIPLGAVHTLWTLKGSFKEASVLYCIQAYCITITNNDPLQNRGTLATQSYTGVMFLLIITILFAIDRMELCTLETCI